jgi:hypothetical protein
MANQWVSQSNKYKNVYAHLIIIIIKKPDMSSVQLDWCNYFGIGCNYVGKGCNFSLA